MDKQELSYLLRGVYIGRTTLEGNLAISRQVGNVPRCRPRKHARAQENTDKDVHHSTALLAKV